MTQLKLYLFGPPRLVVDNNRTINISLRKAQAMIAYLAVTNQPQSRDSLSTLFWPEADQRKARTNLRRMLYDIGQRVQAPLLATTAETVYVDPTINLWVDTIAFRESIAIGLTQPLSQEQLLSAANLHNDEFMAGFNLNDCPDFDDWQFFQREELRQALSRVLISLTNIYVKQDAYEEALLYAKRWLALDKLHEAAHRRLMELYMLAGQRAAALRQYEECVRIMDGELGVAPESETTDLFKAIRARKQVCPGPESGPASVAVSDPVSNPTSDPLAAQEWNHSAIMDEQGSMADAHPRIVQEPLKPENQQPVIHSQPPRQNLPNLTTQFIGRQQEIEEILQRITDPACSLLTLIGPGGIGKTRLALKTAERAAALITKDGYVFPDGVYFVPLQPIESFEHIIPAIADAIDYHFSQERPPLEQLLEQMINKHMLLILDNFEHLLDRAELLVQILTIAPLVKMLVTSRDALPLQEAWFHPITGMVFPGTHQQNHSLVVECDAIQLFEQCARQFQITYILEDELEHVVRVCRLVEGMPLALELASTWLKVISTKEIADEIEQSLDLLESQNQQVPERHRSIRAVFEQTWQRLSTVEQGMLKRFSIFRGGCTRDAAEAVGQATLPILVSLVEKALIRRNPTGRYEVHELIRQLADEYMKSTPQDYHKLHNRHSHYYASLLQEQEQVLKGKEPGKALAKIMIDLDNVRQGWRWAAQQQDAQTLNRYVESLYLFYELQGLLQEGAEAFRYALAQFATLNNTLPDTEQQYALGQLFARCGGLEIRLGCHDEGISLMQQSEKILRGLGPKANRALARVLSHLGQEIHRKGDEQTSIQLLQESLQLSRDVDDEWMMGLTWLRLGQVAEFQGKYVEAEPYFHQSIDIYQRVGEQRFRAFALNNQGRVAYAMGEYERAKRLISTAHQIREELGDQVGTAYSHLDAGKLATLVGDYSEAKMTIEKALQSSKELGERDLVARCLNALGVVSRLQGELGQAEEHHQTSFTTYMEINVQIDIPDILTNLGVVALERGEFLEAEKKFRESLGLSNIYAIKGATASTLRYLGHLSIVSKPIEGQDACSFYRQALDLAIEINAVPMILDVFAGMAHYWMGKGEISRAEILASLVMRHPSTTYATRINSQALKEKLGLDAPSKLGKHAFERHPAHFWRELAEEHL
ncbi:MAG: tetratricopeptide repeat protein [Chloroflexota bacterium]